MFTQRKKNIVKEYDAATQSTKLPSQIYKGSTEIASHSENRAISARDKQTDFNVCVEWVDWRVWGVFTRRRVSKGKYAPSVWEPTLQWRQADKEWKMSQSPRRTLSLTSTSLPEPKRSVKKDTCVCVCVCVCTFNI